MKLIAIASSVLLLAGCTSAEPQPTTAPKTATMWDDKDFCDTFETWRENYQTKLDGPEATVESLKAFTIWADALKEKAPAELAEKVDTFTVPLYVTEDTTVNLVELFMAGNELGSYCVTAN